MMQFCFATEIRGCRRLISGGEYEPRGMKGMGQILTSRGVSSLVTDSLCDQVSWENVAVACFYFNFTAQKEQSSTCMLGALPKQAVGRLAEVQIPGINEPNTSGVP